jgi:4-hydroxymandelate oxidase
MALTRRDALYTAGGVLLAGLPFAGRARAQTPAAPAPDPPIPEGAVSLADFEPLARGRMAPMAYEYVCGGAADEISLRWNREAFERIRLKPRVLVDVSRLDTRVTLLGRELPFPVLLAPTAYQRLVHPEGERATARGAAAAGATLVVSTLATTPVEELARAGTPLWFQLYVQPDRGFTRALAQRAEAAGCQALVVTVDTPIAGARNREVRAGFELPPGMALPHLAGLQQPDPRYGHRPKHREIFSSVLDPTLTWTDVEWLRSFARVPVLLKGILNPDDAARALDAGVAGLVVSNHGARNLDTVPATIDALPAIAERIAGRIPLLLDGGVRRGTDVLKALALGATAVLIGRPYLYGLGAAGAAGVARVVEVLRSELEMALALTGRRSLAELDRTLLW